MLQVFQDADKVMIDLMGRKRDVLLAPLDAEKLADSLEQNATLAELAEPQLIKGEMWGCQVTSFDKKVAMRFTPPGSIEAKPVERVPLPPKAARALADLLRTNANMAGHGLRIERG